MITVTKLPLWVLRAVGFLVLIAVCVALVLLAGIGDEPCMEFNGWRWEPVWPRPEHCGMPMVGE